MFGGAGYLRSLQLLAYSVELPPIMTGQDPYHYILNTLCGSIKQGFKEQGNLFTKDGLEKGDTAFLVAFRGNLYYVSPDFAMDEWVDGYAAIGSGSAYALGSLYSTKNMCDSETRLKLALEAAGKFDEGVSPPFEVLSISWKGYEHGDRYTFYDSDGERYHYKLEDEKVPE